jgi:hypothetical protein
MKAELQQKLVDEFPTFFKDIGCDPMKSCMAFGCEIGDGWFDLLYETCKKIAPLDTEKRFYFLQVKEKFGGLRLYCAGGNDEIYKITSKAEDESYKICEDCGSRENVTSEGGWIVTLCDKCRASNGK